jgi:hypothetical protein
VNAIDERISELVSAHRPQLEQLVRQAVDRELAALVDAELARRSNGSTAAGVTQTTKSCRGPCGRTLPASSFERHRHVCRDCRRHRDRDREHGRAAVETEPPRPAGDRAG